MNVKIHVQLVAFNENECFDCFYTTHPKCEFQGSEIAWDTRFALHDLPQFFSSFYAELPSLFFYTR